MSKTLFIEYREEGFWAYDVAVGVFLKHLIDRAGDLNERRPLAWLGECIARWRVNAVVSDIGVHLDPDWTDEQRQVVRGLIDEACQELRKCDAIPAEVASSWQILDGCGIFTRGATRIATAPVAELGRAIGLLLDGKLPAAPAGNWWFYGLDEGVSTMRKLK